MKPTLAAFIGGFTETGVRVSGMELCRNEAHAKYDHLPNIEVSPVYEWDSDWKAVAGLISRSKIERVLIFAYSWGGGWGAQKLTKYLLKAGVEVVAQRLCDAVYRPGFSSRWWTIPLSFRALMPGFATIKIDNRVSDVDGIRQDRVLPMGHPIKWHGKKFRVHLIQRPNVSHSNIDDSPEWKHLVRRTLQQHLT